MPAREAPARVEARRLEKKAVLLTLSGSFDLDSTPRLAEVLGDLPEEEGYKAILDLTGVTYMSSTGWGLLLSVARKLERLGGGMRLAGMPERVEKVFGLLELSSVLDSAPSVEAALKSFRKG